MADPLYARLVATANRLIAQYGKTQSLHREIRTGDSFNPTYNEITYDVELVETNSVYSSRLETLVATGDRTCLVSTSKGVNPKVGDSLTFDSQRYRIVESEPLSPSDVVVLTEVIARK